MLSLNMLEQRAQGGAKDRIIGELRYAHRLTEGTVDNALVEKARILAEERLHANGAWTMEDARRIEEILEPLRARCKAYRLLFVGHAHIDMNWKWRYDETVRVILDTMRTMLRFMEAYPEFRFSQSQAAIYEMIARYDPQMLEEIKARVQSGQWEVMASSWVESDRNMPNAASLLRQFAQAKQYMHELMELPEGSLRIDFAPDAFGQSDYVPEILSSAGIQYAYHCRGINTHSLYWWEAPSGKRILTYHDPHWYKGPPAPAWAEFVPSFCREHGVDTAMRAYGVSDHGGGPTRKHIECIKEIQSWPIYPTVEFGTYAQFFTQVQKATRPLPVRRGETTRLLRGCYITQAKVKRSNKLCERLLGEAEAWSAFAGQETEEKLSSAWRQTMFNQFHDIITGSCTAESRDYALGMAQKVYADGNCARLDALKQIESQIDLSFLPVSEEADEWTEGAGAGLADDRTFGALSPQVRGVRPFCVFNALPYARKACIKLTLWDFECDPADVEFVLPDGTKLLHQMISPVPQLYWEHHYLEAMVELEVPAMGYQVCYARRAEKPKDPMAYQTRGNLIVEDPVYHAIENEVLRVSWGQDDCLFAVEDKRNGRVVKVPGFVLRTESTELGMTAWKIGPTRTMQRMNRDIHYGAVVKGAVYEGIRITVPVGTKGSMVECDVELERGSDMVKLSCRGEWYERGTERDGMPHLSFEVEAADETYVYDVPGGWTQRAAGEKCEFGASFVATGDASKPCVMLMSDSHYGYGADGKHMRVSLLRGALDPDPFPDAGENSFTLAIACKDACTAAQKIKAAGAFVSPLSYIHAGIHPGTKPAMGSYLQVDSNKVQLLSIRKYGKGMQVWMSMLEEAEGYAELTFSGKIGSAWRIDAHGERADGDIQAGENVLCVSAAAHELIGVYVEMA